MRTLSAFAADIVPVLDQLEIQSLYYSKLKFQRIGKT